MTRCPVCSSRDVRPVLQDREDREYHTTTRLCYYRCLRDACGHIFVSPMPSADLIGSFYQQYTTHGNPKPSFWALPIVRLDRWLSDRRINEVMRRVGEGGTRKALDFGCGSGGYAMTLKASGIDQVIGFDFDEKAVAFARSRGVDCYSDFEKVRDKGPFDLVILNHVVEHLVDPKSTLSGIGATIREGGVVEIRTPNSISTLRSLTGNNWRGWETPRHLNIYNVESAYLEFSRLPDLELVSIETSNKMIVGMAFSSLPVTIRNKKILRWSLSLAFIAIGLAVGLFSKRRGEELCVTLRKKAGEVDSSSRELLSREESFT